MPGIKLIGNVTIAVVLVYGGYLAFHGEVTVGVLAAFLLYLRQFFEPMQEISQFYNTFQSASAALEKLSGVLGEEPGVPEPTAPASRWTTARGELRFDGVGLRVRRGPSGAARPRPECRPARPSPWSAPPVPARPRWPSWFAVLRPDRRARCCSTASTCAT